MATRWSSGELEVGMIWCYDAPKWPLYPYSWILLFLRFSFPWLSLLSRFKVYSILYSSTLILPSNRRGGGCWGCCCCWPLWERTRSIILLHRNTGGIYSNNLVCTDHVCSCLVTSAAWEWINQSCDDRYPVYWFTAYQRDTGWSYHRLQSVTGIRFTRSVGDCSSSTIIPFVLWWFIPFLWPTNMVRWVTNHSHTPSCLCLFMFHVCIITIKG